MPDPPRQTASSLKGQMVAWPGGAGLCDPRVPARGGWSPSLTSAGLRVSFTTFTCVLVNPSLARPSMCCRLGPSLAAIAPGDTCVLRCPARNSGSGRASSRPSGGFVLGLPGAADPRRCQSWVTKQSWGGGGTAPPTARLRNGSCPVYVPAPRPGTPE